MTAENANNNIQTVTTVSAAVDKCLYPFDFLYDYYVPLSLEGKISAGQTVMVPFGKGNQARVAMVYRVEKKSCDPSKLKPILSISENGIKMTREQLELSEWIKENTFCTYFDAVKTMLPPGLNFSVRAKYSLNNENSTCDLSQEEDAFFAELKSAKTEKQLEILLSCLSDSKDTDKKKTAQSLLKKGFILKKDEMKRQIGDQTELMVRLREDFQQNDRMAKLTPKQKAVIDTLAEYESASVGELCYICAITSAVIKNLVKYGILEEYQYQLTRAETANAEATGSPDDIILSENQQIAYNKLETLMTDEKPRCALLHGVTGSGKTSIFIKLIDKAIKSGKTALMLVPEISLTPQTVRSFQGLFGNNVAIIPVSYTPPEPTR
ncbi:MAG: DEAD/DEAH box helicase family protein, partial [Ruminiclostridium sp.]|nr:DEAD/DEAH box helicase family protein [Ruminiclostridium sp.]